MMVDIQSFYTSVLSQTLSPCESFLAAGTNFGNVNVFNINKLYNSSEDEKPSQGNITSPQCHIPVSTKPVQAMVSSSSHLIVGGRNCISGYNWDLLVAPNVAGKSLTPNWKMDLHLPMDLGAKETVDCMDLGGDSSLYAACGDNKVHLLDIEHGKEKMCFSGHTDFIHSMSQTANMLATASEDGTVCLWDTRKSKPVHTIVPCSNPKLNRPQLGKWVGAVAMSEDWLVCGGGPHLALYHLRSLTMSRVLLENDVHAINCVTFYGDSIIVGVDGPVVYHTLFSGDITVEMPTTPLRVYSICLQKKDSKKLLTVGGASGDIDICKGSKLQDYVVRCPS